jgi:hypothetical protein
MGYVDQVLFGYEVVTELLSIDQNWVDSPNTTTESQRQAKSSSVQQ